MENREKESMENQEENEEAGPPPGWQPIPPPLPVPSPSGQLPYPLCSSVYVRIYVNWWDLYIICILFLNTPKKNVFIESSAGSR